MEDKNFLDILKELENKDKINCDSIEGIINQIEQIDYNLFKISIIIENDIYNELYIKDLTELSCKKIFIYELSIMKENGKKKILIDSYDLLRLKKSQILNKEKNNVKKIYNLSDIPKILNINELEKYNSGLFFYKSKTVNSLIFNSFEELNEINIKLNSDNQYCLKEIEQFFNNLTEGKIIFIDNYLIKNDKISFINFTSFHLADGLYLAEYFQKKYNRENNYYKQIVYYNNSDIDKYESNYLFIKVIYISDEYIIGIDQYPKLYKIIKYQDKLKKIDDIYLLLLIRNYEVSFMDNINILILNDNSNIFIFNNSFFDSFINDLTVINFNFPDFMTGHNNFFNKIILDNDYSFNITRNFENIIINNKKGKFNYYMPYEIGLKQNEQIDRFKFLLYYGLLNKINCFINYNGENKYSCEYFYYNSNSLLNLPKMKIYLDEKEYIIENFDTFNSKIRKRYVLINIPKNEYINIYKNNFESYRLQQLEKSKKNNEMNKSNESEIKDKKQYDLDDKNIIESEKLSEFKAKQKYNEEKNENNLFQEEVEEEEENSLLIQTLYKTLQFCFYFDEENKKSKLVGIFDIEEIIPEEPVSLTEKLLEKYELFYDYYKVLMGKKQPNDEYLKNIEAFGKDKYLTDLVLNHSYFEPNIKYKYYIIYINICLFFYMRLMKNKNIILKLFKHNLEEIQSTNLTISQKIRIMRFTCKESFKTEYDNKDFNLILLDSLPKDNAYKLAFNYNIQIINNITEQSELYLPFLQLDNYILLNYYLNFNSYTLSMEPLIITKNHLLSLYEPFLFVSIEQKISDVKTRLACQCTNNDITMINRMGLFGDKTGLPHCEKNKNLVIPISMELIHEKNGHSKKLRKNKRQNSPIYFYTKNNIIHLDESNQNVKGERGESGRLVEYFINYKEDNFVSELKSNFIYEDILSDTKYFTDNNFKKLYEKIKSLKSKKNSVTKKTKKQSNCEINDEKMQFDRNVLNNIDENFDDTKLEIYEKKYLWKGKYFVFPDSIPFIYPSKDGSYHKPLGLKLYLEKYKKQIEEGRKLHYCKDD